MNGRRVRIHRGRALTPSIRIGDGCVSFVLDALTNTCIGIPSLSVCSCKSSARLSVCTLGSLAIAQRSCEDSLIVLHQAKSLIAITAEHASDPPTRMVMIEMLLWPLDMNAAYLAVISRIEYFFSLNWVYASCSPVVVSPVPKMCWSPFLAILPKVGFSFFRILVGHSSLRKPCAPILRPSVPEPIGMESFLKLLGDSTLFGRRASDRLGDRTIGQGPIASRRLGWSLLAPSGP